MVDRADEGMFKPIQQWERAPNSLHTVHQITTAGVEEVMVSKPYGITSDIDVELNICTHDLYLDLHERQIDYVSPRTYNPNASYLPYRRYLVDWMSDVEEIPRSQWQLFATACITIASKYEEAEEHCPHIPELLRMTKLSAAGHTSLSFRDGELQVLRRLGWRLRAVPPLKVVEYYLQKGVCFDDDLWQQRALIPKIPRYVKKYAEFFANLTLQDYSFQQYLPTKLAAAMILASRVALQLEPRWRPELVQLTGYEEEEIVGIFEHCWSYYAKTFPGHGARSISPRGIQEF